MKSIYKKSFIATLAIHLGGFSVHALADDSFPLPHNFVGYGNTCTIGPKQTVLCDSGYNGNQYYWFTVNPISQNGVYLPNGAGFFTDKVPRMIFAAESLADATKIRVTNYLSNGITRWQERTAWLGSDGKADVPQGFNGNYRYNIEITNNSKRTVRVKYHICAEFYGAGGDMNGTYCGTLPAPAFTPPIKPVMCGSNDAYGMIVGMSNRPGSAKDGEASITQYMSGWYAGMSTFLVPDDGGEVSAMACGKYHSSDLMPYAIAGTDTGNLYGITYQNYGNWRPMNRPHDNYYPITAMTGCPGCKFSYAGDSGGDVYMYDTEKGLVSEWTLFGGGKIPSRITALTIGSNGSTNAVYAGGTGGRVWISGNDVGTYWADLAVLPTDGSVTVLASNIGSPYIYAADNNNTWRAKVNDGAGAKWEPMQIWRPGPIVTSITAMYITNYGSSANRYVYMGDSGGQTWVRANTDDNRQWTQLAAIGDGKSAVTSFAQGSDNEIQVLLSDGSRYRRKLSDNDSAWQFMDKLP